MVKFDENKSTYVEISTQNEPVALKISEDLDLFDEEVSGVFAKRISEFIDRADYWFPVCIRQMASEKIDEVRLISIFILSEQDDPKLVLGLEFNVGSDEEHGRGFKIDGDDFSIIEYGLAEVAFS